MLEGLGASIVYDYQRSDSAASVPDALPPGSRWLRSLLGEHYASEPIEIQLFSDRGMSPDKFGDDEAEQIGLFTELEWLVLFDTKLTDAGLRHLKGLTKLRRLDIERTDVTEAGVNKLQQSLPEVDVYY
jgi:hypothetical protein